MGRLSNIMRESFGKTRFKNFRVRYSLGLTKISWSVPSSTITRQSMKITLFTTSLAKDISRVTINMVFPTFAIFYMIGNTSPTNSGLSLEASSSI